MSDSFTQQKPAQQKPAQPILKLAVMADGRITVNGAPATLQSLRDSLKTLSQQKGVVWYYREAANTEGPPIAKDVVQAIVDARLPVRHWASPHTQRPTLYSELPRALG